MNIPFSTFPCSPKPASIYINMSVPHSWGYRSREMGVNCPLAFYLINHQSVQKKYIKQHRLQYQANEMQTETGRVVIAIPLFANHKSCAFICYTSRHANQCAVLFCFVFFIVIKQSIKAQRPLVSFAINECIEMRV